MRIHQPIKPEDRESAIAGLLRFIEDIKAGKVAMYAVGALGAGDNSANSTSMVHATNGGIAEVISEIASLMECDCGKPGCPTSTAKDLIIKIADAFVHGASITVVGMAPVEPIAGTTGKPH